MSNLTDFFPSGGGGLTPKFEEFNASGTFTPSQALIDAGGYIEVFLVGGGATNGSSSYGANGGEVLIKKMYLSNTNNCSVSIGSGGATNSSGSNSTFSGASAGGQDLTAYGGLFSGNNSDWSDRLGNGWRGQGSSQSAGTGVFGYGAGGGPSGTGVRAGKPNSGQGGCDGNTGGSGYCLIKWYE